MATESILLEAMLANHALPVLTKNPFKTKTNSPKKTTTAASEQRFVGSIQLIVRKQKATPSASETSTQYFLRFTDVRVSNEKNWPLFVLLSRANVALAPPTTSKKQNGDPQLRSLEEQGEIVPLDIGPDGGQWCGAQMPTSFEQQIFVYDPLVFASVVICKPSAARPPTALPQVVAHGVFQSYLPPEKTPARIHAELDAIAAKMQNTVMQLEQDALQDDELDLDTLQRNARELFKLFDQDRSNSIDFDEYKQMLAYRGLHLLDAKALRLFQLVDDQKKGFIDEREFVIALYITNSLRANTAKQQQRQTRLKATEISPVDVFYQLDSDRDALLNVFEYEKAMQLLGVTHNAVAVTAQFPKGASLITMDQFKSAWLELIDVRDELRKRGISPRSSDGVPMAPTATATNADGTVSVPHSQRQRRLSLPFTLIGSRKNKRQREQQRLKRILMEWIVQVEHDELQQALTAKDEVCRLDKVRREQEQDEKRGLFAQQRQTETSTRTNEALRERQEKIQRRKDRVVKEKQAREEKKLLTQIADEQQKRALHERQVVQELMATKMDKIVNHKAKHGDDVLDLSHRRLVDFPVAFYKGKDALNALASLLILNLSGNRIRELPGGIFPHLFALQVLDLSDNEIETLPKEIGEARDLQTLDVRHNRLVSLPVHFKLLGSLRVLNVSHNHLESFGDVSLPTAGVTRRESFCTGLSKLEDLDLSYNDTLAALSESIGELQALKMLYLRGCMALNKLPDAIHKLTNLVVFDMSASHQKRIGKHVFGAELGNLRSVKMAFNALTSLPEAMGDLRNLQQLDVSNNSLMAFPEHLASLHELVVFNGTRNKMEKLPERIGELVFLERLDLSRNALRSPLPPTVGLLVSLQCLSLQHNRLCEIPMEMGALIHVRELDLSWNELAWLPDEMGCMASLTSLDLSHNKLAALPDAIVLWQQLELLACSYNALSTPLTPSIEQLTTLRYVDLSFNSLTSLEPCLFRLPKVEVLNLAGNKLSRLPRELGFAEDAAVHGSLRKLDLYNNKIQAIPVEWTSLLSKLDVFSIGRNPMTLLPEKWSDHWRNGKWQRGDVYATSSMNGYTAPQVSEWVHDQSVIYPSILSVWKQHQPSDTTWSSSDLFVDAVHAAIGDKQWQPRMERIVRHFYYEFKYKGHEIVLESLPPEQQERFTRTEAAVRLQQQHRADDAIQNSDAFREKLTRAYTFDLSTHQESMATRRRVHEGQTLQALCQETRQWNDIVSEKLPGATERHDAAVRERKERFAYEMKETVRRRLAAKQQLQLHGRAISARVAVETQDHEEPLTSGSASLDYRE